MGLSVMWEAGRMGDGGMGNGEMKDGGMEG